jgi:hypothetical protein
MRYRKRPVEVEAVQFVGTNIVEIAQFIADRDGQFIPTLGYIDIVTLEGTMTASPGDWVICGVAGELYPCKPDIFEATYEPVED